MDRVELYEQFLLQMEAGQYDKINVAAPPHHPPPVRRRSSSLLGPDHILRAPDALWHGVVVKSADQQLLVKLPATVPDFHTDRADDDDDDDDEENPVAPGLFPRMNLHTEFLNFDVLPLTPAYVVHK